MPQPSSRVPLLLLLLTGAAAGAQPRPERGRTVTLSGNPARPAPVVRVAGGFTTVIKLDSPLDRASVQWDREGFTDVDVGDRFIVLVPTEKLAPGQQWRLRARYLDGAQPQWAEFDVVVDPSVVDTQLTVTRLRQPGAGCPEARPEPCTPCPSPDTAASLWAFVARVGPHGVALSPLRNQHEAAPVPKLRGGGGMAYRTRTGLLLVVEVVNESESPVWTPKAATVKRQKSHETLSVRMLAVEEGARGPGTRGRVAVEVDLPAAVAGGEYTLQLHGEDGRLLTLRWIIPPAPETATAWRQ